MPKRKQKLPRAMRHLPVRINPSISATASAARERADRRKAIESLRRQASEGGPETPELARAFNRLDKANESVENAISEFERASVNANHALMDFTTEQTEARRRTSDDAERKMTGADAALSAAMREYRNALSDCESAMRANRDGGRPLTRAERRRLRGNGNR